MLFWPLFVSNVWKALVTWNIDLCADWAALIDVAFVSYRLYRGLSVLFLDACLHRPHSFRGQRCFYLLSFAQMSFNSSVNMDSFHPRSPARGHSWQASHLCFSPWPPFQQCSSLAYGFICVTFNSVLWEDTAFTFVQVFHFVTTIEPFSRRSESRRCSTVAVGVSSPNLLSLEMSQKEFIFLLGSKVMFSR